MRRVTEKWLKQAEADLKAAEDSLDHGHYEWSCFQSQQAAEKALKAFLYEKGYTSIMTHSLKELLRECSRIEEDFTRLATEGRRLDMYYIPTRYPNGLGGDLAPAEFYEEEDARQCLSSAELILKEVKKYLKK
jgi:HEPN domain-containing protein